MAQHDYVIANGTGAAVRSDLNNALAAIVSQNSGATEPATTYAFQFWADTTTNLLKLRNSANNAWVTLFQLDGEWNTLPVENGTAAAPSIYFKDSGTDTGFYSPGTDQVAISTGGTGRLFIDASGNIGINTSPSSLGSSVTTLEIKGGSTTRSGGLRVSSSDSSVKGAFYIYDGAGVLGTESATPLDLYTGNSPRLRITSAGLVGIGTTTVSFGKLAISKGGAEGIEIEPGDSSNVNVIQHYNRSGAAWVSCLNNAAAHIFTINGGGNEKARIDSSGRLLVGTSSARTGYSGNTPEVQIEAAKASDSVRFGLCNNSNGVQDSQILLAKTRGTSVGSNTVVQDGDTLGRIQFLGADGTDLEAAAQILAQVDGTPGNNDMPGRLVFSTTADGASSPTERMRILSGGQLVYVTPSGVDTAYFKSATGAGTTDKLLVGMHSGSFTTGTASFQVFTNGNVQNTNNSYTAISDIKLKENIVDASSQWDDIKALQVRNYNLKEGQTHKQIGLIAQEVEPISPGLVYESPDRDEDGNDLGTVTKSVNYSVLYMKAVKALQEAMERIEVLEQRLTDAGIA